MRRSFDRVRAVLGVAALTVTGCCMGLAASLALATDSIGANRVTTSRCTAAALAVVPNLSGGNIASVTVSSLPSTCGNATIQAAVNDGSLSSTGSATVPAAGGSVTVTLVAAVPATAATELDIVLTGP